MASFFDRLFSRPNRAKDGAVSTIWYLAQSKVPRGARREAYTALRREYLPAETKKQLDLAHSEVHVLYITFLELFSLGVLLWRSGREIGIFLTGGAILFLCAAWAADIRLDELPAAERADLLLRSSGASLPVSFGAAAAFVFVTGWDGRRLQCGLHPSSTGKLRD